MTNTKGIGGMLQVGLLLAVLSSTACMATVGVNNVSIPADSAQICGRHCQSIGMRLSAVAIMAENVGCICQLAVEPKPGPAGAVESPAAGMSTIALQHAAAAALQQQQRLRQQQQQQQQRRN